MECVDVEDLLAFYEGHLSPAQREGVESHLDGCPACREELAELARGEDPSPGLPFAAGLPGEGDLSPPPGWRVEAGAQLGRYVLLHPVGQGGMGEVWSAWDPALDRRVALKLLKEGLHGDGTGGQTLLRREALAMARLAHPGVVSIFDVGSSWGRGFVAMEFVAGPTLRTFARGRPWPQVLSALEQAGRGLAAAHHAGIVHRDFKPSNVLIGADGAARVSDFGLARPTSSTASSTGPGALPSPLAPSTTLAGTAGYLAPELLDGAPPTPSSDIYAFCVTARQVLPTSGLPSWVNPIFERGLRPDPGQRWPSMEALLDALEVGRRRQIWRRRVGILAAAVALVSLVVGVRHGVDLTRCQAQGAALEESWNNTRRQAMRAAFVATTGSWGGPTWDHLTPPLGRWVEEWSTQRTGACMQERSARGEALELATRRVACLEQRRAELGALLDVFGAADHAVVEGAIEAVAALPRPSTCLDNLKLLSSRPVPTDPSLRGEIEGLRRRLAAVEVRRQAGLYVPAQAEARVLLGEARGLHYPPLLSEAHYVLGQAEQSVGDYQAGEANLLEAIYLAEASHHDNQLARAWISLVPILSTLERSETTLEHARRQARAAVLRLGEDPDQRWDLLVAEGHIADHAHHNQVALERYEAARGVLEARGGEAGTSLAAIYTFIGGIQGRLRHPSRSLAAFGRALEILRARFGEEHPRVATATSNYARQLTNAGRLEEALTLNQRAMDVGRRTFPPLHPTLANIALNLGTLLRDLNRPREALPILEEASTAARSLGGDTPTFLHTCQEAQAETLLELGRPGEVLDLTEGPAEALSVRLLASRVTALLDLGQWEQAALLLPLSRQRSLDPGRRSNFDRILAEHNTARLQAAEGDVSAAIATLSGLEVYMISQVVDRVLGCRMGEVVALHTRMVSRDAWSPLVGLAHTWWGTCGLPRYREPCREHSRWIGEHLPGSLPLPCP